MKRMLFFLIFLIAGCAGHLPYKIKEGEFKARSGAEPLAYELLWYKTPEPQEKFPLIVIMHGADMDASKYLDDWTDEALKYQTMLLAPIREHDYQDNEESLREFKLLIEDLSKRYPIDKDRIYIAGVSSGALIARWLVVRYPSFWRGAVFMASEPFEDWMSRTDVSQLPPLFYLHGGRDPQYPVEKIKERVESLRKRKAQVNLVVDEEAEHEYRPEWNEAIFKWIQQTYSKIK